MLVAFFPAPPGPDPGAGGGYRFGEAGWAGLGRRQVDAEPPQFLVGEVGS